MRLPETTTSAALRPASTRRGVSAKYPWRASLRAAASILTSAERIGKGLRALRAAVRSIGTTLRQYDFERTALPFIPEDLAMRIIAHDVLIPPATMVGKRGAQTLDGLLWLACIAKSLRALRIFEIGTLTGYTSLVLASNVPQATVHTLDLPPGTAPELPIWGSDSCNFLPGDTPRAWHGRPEESRIILHLADSARFDFEPFRGMFDVVYVDGAHSWEYLAKDSDSAFTLVSARGAIVWDDYWEETPEVVAYLNSRKDLRLFRLPQTRLVVWLSAGAEETIRNHDRL